VLVAASPLVITTSVLPRAARRTPYAAQLSATGGSGPRTWSRVRGSLPKGLRLTAGGRVVGTPTVRRSVRLKVRVRDAAGSSATRWVRLRVR
jgi:hypothetical protein